MIDHFFFILQKIPTCECLIERIITPWKYIAFLTNYIPGIEDAKSEIIVVVDRNAKKFSVYVSSITSNSMARKI